MLRHGPVPHHGTVPRHGTVSRHVWTAIAPSWEVESPTADHLGLYETEADAINALAVHALQSWDQGSETVTPIPWLRRSSFRPPPRPAHLLGCGIADIVALDEELAVLHLRSEWLARHTAADVAAHFLRHSPVWANPLNIGVRQQTVSRCGFPIATDAT
jgi:hypothetical protein